MAIKIAMNNAQLRLFRINRRYEFDHLWKSHFSMLPPLDSISASLRDKLKEFSWQVYLEGSIMTQIDTEEIEKEKHYRDVSRE